jgi:tRNA (guanine37-N1)-methyltransferase
MKFDIITIFPQIFNSYLSESILARAQKDSLIEVNAHDLRNYASDKHNTVDDTPYGGGAGMVLMAEPILKAVESIKPKKKSKIIVFSAKGRQFNQKMAYEWSKNLDQLILISGRYEGIDERVVKALDAEEISIGPYVLTDGEVPAMAIISSVSRLIPGVIQLESLEEESHWDTLVKEEKDAGKLEYPHYTKPETIEYKDKSYKVPDILLSGNHAEVEKWRKNHRK